MGTEATSNDVLYKQCCEKLLSEYRTLRTDFTDWVVNALEDHPKSSKIKYYKYMEESDVICIVRAKSVASAILKVHKKYKKKSRLPLCLDVFSNEPAVIIEECLFYLCEENWSSVSLSEFLTTYIIDEFTNGDQWLLEPVKVL